MKPAYARIVGRIGGPSEYEQIDEPICNLPITIGRAEITKDGDVHHLRVGSRKDNTISRKHAMISWNEEENKYKLQCLSKNSCTVDGKIYTADDTVDIHSKSSIRIGSARFYFILPPKNKVNDSVSEQKQPLQKQENLKQDKKMAPLKQQESKQKQKFTPQKQEKNLASNNLNILM